jgi:uncharacterized membrane protein
LPAGHWDGSIVVPSEVHLPIVTRSAEVSAAPNSIFEYLREGEHVGEWLPDVLRSERLTDGPVQAGSRFRYVFRVLGRSFEIVNEITDLDPARRIGFRAVTGVGNRGQFDLVDLDHGLRTRVTLWLTFDLPGGPVGLMARVVPVAAIVDHYAQVALVNLVRRLEKA